MTKRVEFEGEELTIDSNTYSDHAVSKPIKGKGSVRRNMKVSRDWIAPVVGYVEAIQSAEQRTTLTFAVSSDRINCRALGVRKSESQELVGMAARPSTVGIIGFHARSDLGGLGAEILFVNHPILIDDEGFYA
jgi:hypothetical protein